jgi:hypothetical protein
VGLKTKNYTEITEAQRTQSAMTMGRHSERVYALQAKNLSEKRIEGFFVAATHHAQNRR